MRQLKSTLVLILLSIFFAYSCTSPEKKFKKAIKEELRLTLHDFDSYEPVQFGKLEVAMSSWEDLPEVNKYLNETEKFTELYKEYGDKADIYSYDYSSSLYRMYHKMYSDYLDSAKKYLEKINAIELHFSPEPIGWQMQHTFRANNLAGNKGIHHYLFMVDKEYKKVIKSINLDEE